MKKKCLIFFTIGIGDSLMVTPAIEKIVLSDSFELEALTISPQVTDIAANSGYFKDVHFIDFLKQDTATSISSVLALRKKKYDISILVFPSNNYRYHLIHLLTGAKKRFGIRYIKKDIPNLNSLSGKLLNEDRSLHAIEQNFRLFEFALGIKLERSYNMTLGLNERDRDAAQDFIASNGLDNKTLVGIHAGSDTFKNMVKKRWSDKKYTQLINSFEKEKSVHFILFGAKQENDLNSKILDSCGGNCSMMRNAPYFHSAALVERCSAFVCGDTGLMHTAAALKVPVVAIFGPTSSVYAAPLNEGSVVIKKDYSCIPCYEYSRKPLSCDQKRQFMCLEDISVNEVIEALSKILKPKGEK